MNATVLTARRLALLSLAAALCHGLAEEAPVPDSEAAARKVEPQVPPPAAKPSAPMQAVLDELSRLGGKPLTGLSPEEARKQPAPADAVKSLLKKQGKDEPEKVGKVEDVNIDLGGHQLDGRIYLPEGKGPFPVILYVHGGGWVLADLDTYDATPRALCNATQAMVISTDYRHAPEHPFPAAHEDVFGAYQWALKNAGRWAGDATRIALVGESAGGNLAAGVSIMAQDKHMQMPVHQVLVYPVADTSMSTETYRQYAEAVPLNSAMMKWFFERTFAKPEDWTHHLVHLMGAKTLKGLPPTTVITADIDPLRAEGEALAKKLEADGVAVRFRNFEGVTHEFFGMGAVVATAREAVDFAAIGLKEAFAGQHPKPDQSPDLPPPPTLDGTPLPP